MSKYPKAKMPDYGDGPEPCVDCAIKDKRIAELEDVVNEIARKARIYDSLDSKITLALITKVTHISEGSGNTEACDKCGAELRERQDRYTNGDWARSVSFGCPNNCSQLHISEGGADDYEK